LDEVFCGISCLYRLIKFLSVFHCSSLESLDVFCICAGAPLTMTFVQLTNSYIMEIAIPLPPLSTPSFYVLFALIYCLCIVITRWYASRCGIVMNKVSWKEDFFQLQVFSPVSIIPLVLLTHYFINCQCYIILSVDSVVE